VWSPPEGPSVRRSGGRGRWDLGLEEANGVALGDLELRELHEDLPGVGAP